MSTVSKGGLHPGPEEVNAELAAMQAVGRALARLQDPKARARVLRWALERFEMHVETASAGGGVTASIATSPVDQSMTLDGVLELFDEPSGPSWSETLQLEATEPPLVHRDAAQPPNTRRDAAKPEPLDSLVRGLANDFQRFAVEWPR
jgi:hypothetical protein